MQSRNEFRNVAHSTEFCQARKKRFDTDQKTIFVEHELNIPFEMPCFSCYRWVHRAGFLTNFHIQKSDHLKHPAHIFRKIFNENETALWNFVANGSKKSPSALYSLQRARPLDVDTTEFVDLTIFNDGRLLVNPTQDQSVRLNSLSTRCSIVVDSHLQRLDTVLTATTVSKDPSGIQPLSRFRVSDLQEKQNIGESITKTEFNLVYSLQWRPWSCCSACCCKATECGVNFATSDRDCKETVKSLRKRVGYMSISKYDPLKAITGFSEGVVQELEFLLSSEPFVRYGVPLYSTALSNNARSEIKKLFNKESETDTVGMVFDVSVCGTKGRSCADLEACKRREAALIYSYSTKKGGSKKSSDLDESCRLLNFYAFEVQRFKVDLTLNVAENYQIRVNEKLFGKLRYITWSYLFDKKQVAIPNYDSNTLCKNQEKFVVIGNKKDLLIINATSKHAGMVLIGKLGMYDKKVEKTIKVALLFASTEGITKKTTQVLRWIGICAGTLSVVSIAVCSLHSMSDRQMRKKLAQKKAAADIEATNDVIAKPVIPNPTVAPSTVVAKKKSK
ncbi:hypothetical protein QR680_009514 [Steinernema hermaphroditum]|uniref:Uncharacterized protein n=1 Tax=Steinernema hermaphroditum TaxID=289476 RepID=A0AA39IKK0_9BILA|nr:hypothetical protein QR680_009514 [Steinernema hermaphroditum]